jgi:SAM-dependent methyltransferase
MGRQATTLIKEFANMKLNRNLNIDRYCYAINSLRTIAAHSPGRVVFDIGPGDGRMRRIRQEGFEWHGFDRTPWEEVQQWDLSLPYPNPSARADVVLLLDVIEHLPNPGLALKHVSEVLREGGFLILTTPNPRWSGSRLNTLVRGVASGFSEQDLDENYHVFTPWPHILERLLSDVGLQIEEYVTLDGWTTPLRADGRLFLPARYLLNVGLMLIEHLDDTAKGMCFGLLARKQFQEATPAPYPSLNSGAGQNGQN